LSVKVTIAKGFTTDARSTGLRSPIPHKIGQFGDVLPDQSCSVILKKRPITTSGESKAQLGSATSDLSVIYPWHLFFYSI